MRRILATLAIVAAAGCGETIIASFGNLDTPVSLAAHEPSGRLFIANQGSNDLKVVDVGTSEFLVGPAALFPLSIPTVNTPIEVEAARRFVFVVSGSAAEVGFVDTEVPPGAFGPRSVDGPDGFPITIAVDTVPTAGVAFTGAFGFAEGGALADHFLLAGLSPDGDGGSLVAIRPPHLVTSTSTEPLPSIATTIDLPGIFPAGIALDPPGTQAPIPGVDLDCRTVAIADANLSPDHVPGVWLTKARIAADGAISLDPVSEAERIELRVPVTLPDGSIEERVAAARAVAFAPSPALTPALEAALVADPCAQRSGRLFVVLEPSFCAGTMLCPNVAVVDLGGVPGQPGTLAVDATTGGPAAFQLPGAQLGVIAINGTFTVVNAFNAATLNADGNHVAAIGLPELTLFNSTDGEITYLAGGLGTFLEGTGARAAPDPVFLLSSVQKGPAITTPTLRAGSRRGTGAAAVPSVTLPPGARPLNETWEGAFENPLPGFDDVGSIEDLVTGTFALPVGSAVTFLSPIPLVASSDPLLADRLVPRITGTLVCDGFPITGVAPDGRSLVVDLHPAGLVNPDGCAAAGLRLDILPPKALPWTLTGSVTGFVGRASDAQTSSAFAASDLLFAFTPPPPGSVARGTIFAWSTSSGFAFFRAAPIPNRLIAAAMTPFMLSDGASPTWKIFVAYSGADTVLGFFPEAVTPADGAFKVLQ
ncbi:hypothetical protein [Vulgatibacter incomptus]|uniref:Uncharacterized protein n=1 Tax=Vulgatibacter incomptus TaxID=1391653 RepID=A0A0K1PDA9_9BACT|nr:hypothetical protein [Vulgatibacter incomptus]AKU91528.1 hypothetical protein AKJ08_1915 [Vulgatibacter incomptus]